MLKMFQCVLDKFCVVEILGSRGQVTKADRPDAGRILDENVIVGEVRIHLDGRGTCKCDTASVLYQFPDTSGVVGHNAVNRIDAGKLKEVVGGIPDTEPFCHSNERLEGKIPKRHLLCGRQPVAFRIDDGTVFV